MLDWPGRLSATVFLGGCDFRCPFCHNGALVEVPEAAASWSELIGHVETRRDWLDGVVITGGEPTLDPDLPQVLRSFVDLGVAVKLDTNGNNPEILDMVISEGLVQFVAMDLKTTFDRYAILTGSPGSGERVAESSRILIDSGIPHEFRTTAYPGSVVLDDLESMASCVEGGDRYAIQQFVATDTLDPRASAVLPFRPDALQEAVSRCNRYIPTILRGA